MWGSSASVLYVIDILVEHKQHRVVACHRKGLVMTQVIEKL